MPTVHHPYPHLGGAPGHKSSIQKYLGHGLLPSQPEYMPQRLRVPLPVLHKRASSSCLL